MKVKITATAAVISEVATAIPDGTASMYTITNGSPVLEGDTTRSTNSIGGTREVTTGTNGTSEVTSDV